MSWAQLKTQLQSIDDNDRQELDLIKQLVNRRNELGMSQRELANKANVAQSTIARMEVRLVVPSFPTLIKLTNALELEIELLPHSKKELTT